MSALLAVENLTIDFRVDERVVQAVKGISFEIAAGRTLALVGESGSGKSVTAASILRLLPASARIGGRTLFKGTDLGAVSDRDLRSIRGKSISMVFQEPMSSLNPLHTIERQVSEALRIHMGLGKAAARRRTLDLLEEVGIADAASRLDANLGADFLGFGRADAMDVPQRDLDALGGRNIHACNTGQWPLLNFLA